MLDEKILGNGKNGEVKSGILLLDYGNEII
jgi:hypothetical protein